MHYGKYSPIRSQCDACLQSMRFYIHLQGNQQSTTSSFFIFDLLTSFLIAMTTVLGFRIVIICCTFALAAGHTLAIQLIQMKGSSASFARVLTGSKARVARVVATPARLCYWVVILWAKAFHTKASVEHKMGGAWWAGQWTSTCDGKQKKKMLFSLCIQVEVQAQPTVASFAIVMTLLTTKVRFIKALGAFWMAFSGRQLPASRTLYTLIATWTTACVATEVALGADATIAVVAARGKQNDWI